jgi:hypothetical protein
MAFEGPAGRDFLNVESLNTALLELVAADAAAIPMPARLSARLSALDARARGRLAKTPILLLSVREDDLDRWAPVFESRPTRDLLAALDAPPLPVAELAAATLGFLWQLAYRDPYAARVVSGATIEWCEALGEALLVDVLEFGRREAGLLSLRHAESGAFWQRLLTGATSDEALVRQAARLAALQAVLTGSAGGRTTRPLRNAACSLGPAARVAESDRS